MKPAACRRPAPVLSRWALSPRTPKKTFAWRRSGVTSVLTAIRLPAEWAGAHYYFEKARDRQSWDFALVSVAAAMKVEGGTVRDVRLVANSVAPYPMRLKGAEAQVRGKSVSAEVAQGAGDAAVRGAKPLHQNSFKVPLMRNLVRRAVREAVAAT
jgi:xanthine dehydrogenase YagS FAD-binding subunit